MQKASDQVTDNEKLFPGDNWFFYWKTSSALWKEKLSELKSSKIVIPINWAFHTDNGDIFDFHEDKPETDLKRLEEMAHQVGKQLIFFVPISPAPFLVGGGLPHILSRVPSISREGIQILVADSLNQLNKIYSFFDQRVFLSYRKFIKALGRYFSENEMTSNLWAIECGHIQDEQFVSFFEDYSKAYTEAFERFIKIKKQGIAPLEEGDDTLVSDMANENKLKSEFVNDVKELYLETIKEFLPVNYEGKVRIAFLGAAPNDLFYKVLDCEGQNKYSKDLIYCLTTNIIPSSIMLPPIQRKGIIDKQFSDLISNSYMNVVLGESIYDTSDDTNFTPLTNFYLYHKDLADFSQKYFWEEIGLYQFLKENFNWAYQINNSIPSEISIDETYLNHKVFFYNGLDITHQEYVHILKMFMNGGKIVIENTSLDSRILKRFEAFFIENRIELEMINAATRMSIGSMGDGRIVFFNGTTLATLEETKRLDFWSDLIATFDLIYVRIFSEKEIDCLWKTRSPSRNELKFEEVRRVYFYNPTSYKKKVRLNWAKNFALLKINEEINSKVSNETNQSVIEFLPMGSVSMDFGVFY